jgi:hypothetical protein
MRRLARIDRHLIKVALRRFSKPPPSKTVLTDEISVRQGGVPRTITARPPRALRRKNCEFSLRSFCVVGSEMMGSESAALNAVLRGIQVADTGGPDNVRYRRSKFNFDAGDGLRVCNHSEIAELPSFSGFLLWRGQERVQDRTPRTSWCAA